MIEIDLSLNNKEIYKGIKIENFGGRKSVGINQENLNTIGQNIQDYIQKLKSEFQADKTPEYKNPQADNPQNLSEFNESITLTGATAIPVYLAAFHIVVHSFHEVHYKNEMYDIIVARH